MTSQKPMQLGSPNVTYKCSTISPGNPFILGSKVKGQGQVFRQNGERNIAAGCVRKPRWVFPAAMTRGTNHASNTGFSLRYFPAAAATARH